MRQDGAGGAAASAIYPGSPVGVNLFSGAAGPVDSLNFDTVAVDARVRHNAYLESSGADGDYFTRKVTLGPKGSIWGCVISWAKAPDAGNLNYRLASVASPDPDRLGVDDEGTLTDAALSYVLMGSQDLYNVAFTDDGGVAFAPFRIAGEDGDPFTGFLGSTDPFTGFRQINGGAGVYAVKVLVNGKNGASAGFHARVTEMAFVRLDDNGFL